MRGIFRITHSHHPELLALGTDVLISVHRLVDVVAGVAGKSLVNKHDVTKPQGVRGRYGDNSRFRNVPGSGPTPACGMVQAPEVAPHRWELQQVAAQSRMLITAPAFHRQGSEQRGNTYWEAALPSAPNPSRRLNAGGSR